MARKRMPADVAAKVAPDLIDQAGARIDAERLTRRLAKALRRLTDADRNTLLPYAWGDLDYGCCIPGARRRGSGSGAAA
ncbi:hypothetical protein ACLQ2Q_20825 [Microbacterium sp. DT81.1]|uniref:hypothetical protein n=1 Tax=Microbacterium sp. DT81.1 TaxID=3393413 RepID=UPI003CEAA6BC